MLQRQASKTPELERARTLDPDARGSSRTRSCVDPGGKCGSPNSMRKELRAPTMNKARSAVQKCSVLRIRHGVQLVDMLSKYNKQI